MNIQLTLEEKEKMEKKLKILNQLKYMGFIDLYQFGGIALYFNILIFLHFLDLIQDYQDYLDC